MTFLASCDIISVTIIGHGADFAVSAVPVSSPRNSSDFVFAFCASVRVRALTTVELCSSVYRCFAESRLPRFIPVLFGFECLAVRVLNAALRNVLFCDRRVLPG